MRHKYRPGKMTQSASESMVDKMLGVAYARVSDPKQEDEGHSIPAQHRLRADYAAKHGVEVIQVFEETHSAKRSGGRRQFEAMLEFLEGHPEVQHVLVDKIDRLHRNPVDQVRLWVLDRQIHVMRHGKVISKNSPAADKLLYYIECAVGTFQSDNLVEEVMKGMNEKALGGDFPVRAPIGYLNDRNARKIVIDPEHAGFVIRAFELYATCQHSLKDLRDILVAEGFRTRAGKKPGTSQIELILKNPFYQGEFRWLGKIYPGNHEALISRELFDRVQAIATKGKPSSFRGRQFAFGGQYLSCGHCGCAITADQKKGRYVYYNCTHGRGPCPQKRVNEEELVFQFHEILRGLRVPDAFANWVIAVIDDADQRAGAKHDSEVARLTESVSTLRKRVDAAYEDKLDGKISEAKWRERTAAWEVQIADLEDRIAALGSPVDKVADQARATFELLRSAPGLFMHQSGTQQRELLNHVLSNCKMEAGLLVPEYRKPFSLLARAPISASAKNAESGPEDPDSDIKWAQLDSNQ